MTEVPSEVMDAIRDVAREKGSAYLMSYQMYRSGVADCVREGHVSITPGLGLEEAFRTAAMHPDLEGHTLVVTEMFDLNASKALDGYPKTIQGAAKPTAGLN